MRPYYITFVAVFALIWNAAAEDDIQLSDSAIVSKGKASTALVEIRQDDSYGSAFCIDAKGFFISNYHVVSEAGANVNLIISPGEAAQKKVRAKVVRVDKQLDLALLKVDVPIQIGVLPLSTDANLTETQEVMAFGFPFGKDLAINPNEYPAISVNKGRITAFRKKSGQLQRIQIDAIVNPGNSGGPMVDKRCQVIGVVVSGVMGAGAVNFAIPVSHVNTFLQSPVIDFTPPAITRDNLYAMLDFKASALASPVNPGPLDLELVLGGSAGEPERRFAMKLVDNSYSVRTTPLPTVKILTHKIDIEFQEGSLSGRVDDKECSIGARPIKLSDIRRIRNSPAPTVTLKSGEIINGAPQALDAVAVKVGSQTFTVNLNSAKVVNIVSGAGGPSSISCAIIAKRLGKEIGRKDVTVSLDGKNPDAEMADGDQDNNLRDQPGRITEEGAKDVAAEGPRTPLEGILQGDFKRPGRSAARTSYLKVLSTSGDYIGQGKRYSYTGKDMIVKASEGLIEIQVDGWRLSFAPGKGKLLRVGEYAKASRYPFNDTMPGLDFSGNGRGSNRLSGKFIVWEFSMVGTEVKSIAIDFLQRSEEVGPPLSGIFRYNSAFE